MIEYKGYTIAFNNKYNCYYVYWNIINNLHFDYKFDTIDQAIAFIKESED